MKGITFSCWIALGAAACTFKVDVKPGVISDRDAQVETRVPTDDDTDDDDASTITTKPPRDASVRGDGGSGTGELANKHAACEESLPVLMPTAPWVHTDATGRPALDSWRGLGCPNEYPMCSSGNLSGTAVWRCDACLLGDSDAGAGVCFGDQYDCELLTLRDGACSVCVSIMAKARACCAQLPGFDCRPWPYPSDSRRNEGCARHEDCERGLVCKGSSNRSHIGLCVCPEEDAPSVSGPQACPGFADGGR